jgi:glucose/arabinose dehydrogenase
MHKIIGYLSLLLLCYSHLVSAQVLFEGKHGETEYIVEEVFSGLRVPWGMAFLDTDSLLITERNGRLFHLNISTRQLTRIKGLPKIYAEGQGGLLDIALDPRPSIPPSLYLTYSKKVNGEGTTVLAHARLQQNKELINWRDIFVAKTESSTSRHYGSRIAFDGKGHIFLSVGDRGKRDAAQDLSDHAGTIVRLNLDGSIPRDNPFIKQANALPEIWSYGHRNPQGLAFSPDKTLLWSIEHGPRGGDEINLIGAGKNYGWPTISYGKEYWGPVSVGEGTHKKGLEQPVKYYVPSIAPSSLIVYSGRAFKKWQGDLFAGALKLTHLNHVRLNNRNQAVSETRLLEDFGERIRAVKESPEGWIYFSTDSGRILRLISK